MENKIAIGTTAIIPTQSVLGCVDTFYATWALGGGEGPYDSDSPEGWVISYSPGAVTVTVPDTALEWVYFGVIKTGNACNGDNFEVAYFDFSALCLVENISIGDPVWNATTGKWDYLVTITVEGGTPPYSSSPSSPVTISLFPGGSFTLATSTSDSGSCSDSNSTVIGPAPDAPPVAGPCFESGAPASNGAKVCSSGQPCTPTSGNNNVSGDSGNAQSHSNYADGSGNSNSPAPTWGKAKPL